MCNTTVVFETTAVAVMMLLYWALLLHNLSSLVTRVLRVLQRWRVQLAAISR